MQEYDGEKEYFNSLAKEKAKQIGVKLSELLNNSLLMAKNQKTIPGYTQEVEKTMLHLLPEGSSVKVVDGFMHVQLPLGFTVKCIEE